MQHKQKSFTLIEMLIVVVIIGILAAALIPRLQPVQARARDTKRKADLHQIGTALEIYKEDNGWFGAFQGWDAMGNMTRIMSSNPADWDMEGLDPAYLWDFTKAYDAAARYMTAVPMDNSTSRWRASGASMFHWYVFIPLNKSINNWSLYPTSYTLNAFVLGAKTESDGSSSNRVSAVKADYWSYLPAPNAITGDNNGIRAGAICWAACAWGTANLYNTYMCTKTTFTGWATTNDGAGNCEASKDWDDLRYIYVQ